MRLHNFGPIVTSNGITGQLVNGMIWNDNGTHKVTGEVTYIREPLIPVKVTPVGNPSTPYEHWQQERFGNFIPEPVNQDYDEWKNQYYNFKQEVL